MSEQAREVLNDAEMALQGMKANVAKSEKDFEVIAKAVAECDNWKETAVKAVEARKVAEKASQEWQAEAERWRKVAGEQTERLVKADAYIAELESPKEPQKVTEDFAGKWLQQAYVAHEEVEGRHVVTEDCGNAGVVPCQKILDELFAGLDDGIDVSEEFVKAATDPGLLGNPQKFVDPMGVFVESGSGPDMVAHWRSMAEHWKEVAERNISEWNACDELRRQVERELNDVKKFVVTSSADMVNHPPHYKRGSVECIDAIQAALTDEEFRGYCKGNAMKYVYRERHKGGSEDLKKAVWYLERGVK